MTKLSVRICPNYLFVWILASYAVWGLPKGIEERPKCVFSFPKKKKKERDWSCRAHKQNLLRVLITMIRIVHFIEVVEIFFCIKNKLIPYHVCFKKKWTLHMFRKYTIRQIYLNLGVADVQLINHLLWTSKVLIDFYKMNSFDHEVES